MRRGTYSIVARDPSTGEVAAAVQSHWFAVGPIVPWVRAGVGAVCTQSVAERAHGPAILDRLQDGAGAQDALTDVLRADGQAAVRQVGVVDARGAAAAHTGEHCLPFAGHETGDGFSAQANMMAAPSVWPAMARAFEAAAGPLARRLLAALHAAEAQGGDVRGRQSAALLVAPAAGEGWRHTVDVRVDDHPEPLAELDRLLDLRDAYDLATEGDDLLALGRHEEAGECYARAAAIAPGNDELRFWAGLAAAQAGDLPRGLEHVRAAIAVHGGWRDLLDRLPPEFAPSAATVRDALRE